jgi:ABC-type polysaccharide/polyol phosphate export permease
LSWDTGVRKVHRWTSIVFTVAVIVVTVLVSNTGQEGPAEWVYLLPLLPLGILLLTGLFLFVLPYTARLRGRRSTGG